MSNVDCHDDSGSEEKTFCEHVKASNACNNEMEAKDALDECPHTCRSCGQLSKEIGKFTISEQIKISEHRNCTAGTDILLVARDCCQQNYPCGEGEGHCTRDLDCKNGLVCGRYNCDQKKFPSKGTQCCQKSIK